MSTGVAFPDEARTHVLRLLEGGISLTKACSILGIDVATVSDWARKDEEYRRRYEFAREAQAHVLADEMLEIADDPATAVDIAAVGRAKLRIEVRKYLIGVWAARLYGKNSHVTHDQRIGVVMLPPLNTEQKSIKSIAERSAGSEG